MQNQTIYDAKHSRTNVIIREKLPVSLLYAYVCGKAVVENNKDKENKGKVSNSSSSELDGGLVVEGGGGNRVDVVSNGSSDKCDDCDISVDQFYTLLLQSISHFENNNHVLPFLQMDINNNHTIPFPQKDTIPSYNFSVSTLRSLFRIYIRNQLVSLIRDSSTSFSNDTSSNSLLSPTSSSSLKLQMSSETPTQEDSSNNNNNNNKENFSGSSTVCSKTFIDQQHNQVIDTKLTSVSNLNKTRNSQIKINKKVLKDIMNNNKNDNDNSNSNSTSTNLKTKCPYCNYPGAKNLHGLNLHIAKKHPTKNKLNFQQNLNYQNSILNSNNNIIDSTTTTISENSSSTSNENENDVPLPSSSHFVKLPVDPEYYIIGENGKCGPTESIDHVFLSCPRTECLRQKYKITRKNIHQILTSLEGFKFFQDILEIMPKESVSSISATTISQINKSIEIYGEKRVDDDSAASSTTTKTATLLSSTSMNKLVTNNSLNQHNLDLLVQSLRESNFEEENEINNLLSNINLQSLSTSNNTNLTSSIHSSSTISHCHQQNTLGSMDGNIIMLSEETRLSDSKELQNNNGILGVDGGRPVASIAASSSHYNFPPTRN